MMAVIKIKQGSNVVAKAWGSAASIEGNVVTFASFESNVVVEAAGEYTIEIPAGLATSVDGVKNEAANFTFTIKEAEDTAIDGVDAEAENAEIYDLSGRRVNEIVKGGIYIINGKKTLVK